ncbi:MAG: hypothetical protein DRR42_20745 [Gammaproteobacteria bacterium]|nr:MAG: hypothetical protein DRR42_20745 [Gammaproteobacteria bacterium]
MSERSQEEIIQFWDDCPCMVSIVCTTYNHERYLRQALTSFLAQKTTFSFEIIVHDDASTDETTEIIKAFSLRYPELVKTILQDENQYSKGGFKPSIYAAKFSGSKYIALCEGDDYWLDDDKLQIQIDALENHPEVDFSFHGAYLSRDSVLSDKSPWRYGETRIIPLETLLQLKTGSFAPTSSYVFRRTLVEKLPDWFFREAPIGDFFVERYGALRGGALYFKKSMSVYRELTPQSWSRRVQENDEAFRSYIEGMIRSLFLMDKDFSAHSGVMRQVKAKMYIRYAMNELYSNRYNHFKQLVIESVEQYNYVSRKQWLAYRLRRYPRIFMWLLGSKRMIDRL